MAVAVGIPISLGDVEAKATAAAIVVTKALVDSVIQHVNECFEDDTDQKDVVNRLQQIEEDPVFRSSLEAAFMIWAAKTHIILPPHSPT